MVYELEYLAGDVRFNRAKLLNVGYLKALKDYNWDCFIHHDVDLIPENDQNLYVCEEQPKHPAVGRNSTGYKLRYKGYFGGVSAMTVDQFHQVNGFPNTYWGGEDDDLRILIQLQKMTIVCTPAEVARYTMVFHKRDSGYQVNKDRSGRLGPVAPAVCKLQRPLELPQRELSYKKSKLERRTILVLCRSATLVLAYLMLKQNMTLVKAIKTVKEKEAFHPMMAPETAGQTSTSASVATWEVTEHVFVPNRHGTR
ncbi:hypothetical protein IRJ41_020748 [Triplophysa rosa]|uniref:Beta-1,4-galactosyltransferase 4 n=1 Tax=Triplophysa rosa TaxID=992332 RepID=A0A9W7TJ74_TRIRA|nr:hypothetical protein IRJ41_020748 [Triplophysa rosa]